MYSLHVRFGTYGVDQPINAGLDLEMPGPPRWRTPLLILQCLSAQKISMHIIDDLIVNLLTFVQKQARRNPEIVFGDGIERSRDSPETRKFCRYLATQGMVLLKNTDKVLPIGPNVKRVVVIGPNANERIISGGGSAALKPTYAVTPLQGIILNGAANSSDIEYHVGCYG